MTSGANETATKYVTSSLGGTARRRDRRQAQNDGVQRDMGTEHCVAPRLEECQLKQCCTIGGTDHVAAGQVVANSRLIFSLSVEAEAEVLRSESRSEPRVHDSRVSVG